MTIENLNIYQELQKHLDKMPVGFPSTDSGIELRVLKDLFTSKEALIATKLSFMPEPLKKIYRRVKNSGMKIEELEQILDGMYHKGLINFGKRIDENGEEKYYANAPFVIGMFENQLNRLTKEFIADSRQYLEEAFFKEYNKTKIPQLRTIPIEQSIAHEQNIATYDDLRAIIENCGEPIAVAECICRKIQDILGNPCKSTDLREICFSFRNAANTYVDKGLARLITKEEALKILEKVETDGLVIQPGNSQRPMCICCCCGCCCEVLTNQKRFNQPAQFFATNYYAEINPELCVGCGICEDICQMDAISLIDDISTVDRNRCIGCGVCVPKCTSEAIKLQKKEKDTIPPKNTIATYMTIMDKKAELARAEKISQKS